MSINHTKDALDDLYMTDAVPRNSPRYQVFFLNELVMRQIISKNIVNIQFHQQINDCNISKKLAANSRFDF